MPQEEMFGSIETVRACYDKMFQLKVITPQLVINYAHYLEVGRHVCLLENPLRQYVNAANT